MRRLSITLLTIALTGWIVAGIAHIPGTDRVTKRRGLSGR